MTPNPAIRNRCLHGIPPIKSIPTQTMASMAAVEKSAGSINPQMTAMGMSMGMTPFLKSCNCMRRCVNSLATNVTKTTFAKSEV